MEYQSLRNFIGGCILIWASCHSSLSTTTTTKYDAKIQENSIEKTTELELQISNDNEVQKIKTLILT